MTPQTFSVFSIWGPTPYTPNTLRQGEGPVVFGDGTVDAECVIKFATFLAPTWEDACKVYEVFRGEIEWMRAQAQT